MTRPNSQFCLNPMYNLFLKISIPFLVFWGLLNTTPKSLAQGAQQFEAYTQLDGLSNDFIQMIIQDHLGFIWIATENGINRFDGHQFTVFRHSPDDPESLAGNFVWAILEDAQNRLWVGTDRGLNQLHRETGKFKLIDLNPDTISTDQYQIRSIYEDLDGDIWVGTFANGVRQLISNQSAGTWEIKSYIHDPDNRSTPSSNLVEQILEQPKGYLWIGTNIGVDRINKATGQVEHFDEPTPFSGSLVEGFSLDPDGRLIIANGLKGLYRVNQTQSPQLVNDFTQLFYGLESPYTSLEYRIRHIITDQDNVLWIGTVNGLYQSDFDRGVVNHYYHTPEQTGALSFNHINTIFKGQLGFLWVGTYGGGINRMDPNPSPFEFHTHHPYQKESISNSQVRTLLEYEPGVLWVGTLGGGLDKLEFDQQLGWVKSSQYQFEPGNPNTLLSNDLITIIKDQGGKIWIGTNGAGLNCLDPATGQMKAYVHIPGNSNSISHNRIWGLCEDRKGHIWIGTHNHGLNRLNPVTGQIKHYDANSSPPARLTNNGIKAIFEDHLGNLWIGTTAGLNKMNPNTEEVEQFMHHSENPHSVSSNLIWAIFEDSANQLWIGTNLGLNRYDRETGNFERFMEKDGLPSNTVYGILEDDDQNLWISTDKGLARFTKPSAKSSTGNIFRTFDFQDGLGGDAFLPKAYFKSSHTGMLYFGGLHGFNVVHPELIQTDTTTPILVLSSVSRYNPQKKEGTPIVDHFIGNKEKVVLTHLDKVVTFEFANLSFAASDKYQYEYQLTGFSNHWIDLGKKRTITFTGLDPGKYTLLVKARTPDGFITQPTSLLKITVYPPWWASWWAYSIYVLSFLGAVIVIYRFQLNRKMEHQEHQRLKDLDAFKSKLYTNITHEFRTPLTIISGMTDQIKENEKEKKMIKRNSANLLNLVNQILDLKKLETGNLELELIQDNVINYLRYIFESFQSFAQSQGITLHFLADQPEILMDYDPEKLLRVVSNLLSNAIKFTPKGGDVYFISNTLGVLETPRVLEIKIKDTGIGIPAEKLPYIFRRFYQVEDHSMQAREGTGIGLTLSQELVHLMGGKMEVSSKVEKGTTFSISLPINRNAALQNQENKHAIADVMESVNTSLPTTLGTSSSNSDTPLLLIIEDNPDVAQYLIACLQNQYRVELAQNGEEGIDHALDLVPDIIISDVMMPIKDGFEVLNTLKNDERTSHIPIILLTARVDAESKLKGLRRGADAYLTKPFNKEELMIRLNNLLTIRKNLQSRYVTLAPTPPSKEQSIQIEDIFIKKVRQVIEDNMSEEDFDVNMLCHKIGMSRANLHRKIKALTQRSSSVYIRAVRLHKAKQLLETSEMNVSEVAYEVGFRDPKYFSRTFSEEFGLKPKDARN